MCTVGTKGWHMVATGAVCRGTDATVVSMSLSLDLYTLSFNHNATDFFAIELISVSVSSIK